MTTLPPSAQAVWVAPTRNSMVKLEHPKTLHRLSIAIFAMYLWLLVWVIALKCNLIAPVTDNYYKFGDWTWQQKWQFVGESFKALFVENEWGNVFLDARQDLLNVAVYIPFGLYVAYFAKKRKLLWVAVLSFVTSACFEMLQLISLIGCFGAIDLVTNTLGGLIGWGLFKLVEKSVTKHPKGWSIASIVVIVLALPIAIYALVGTIKIADVYWAVLTRTY